MGGVSQRGLIFLAQARSDSRDIRVARRFPGTTHYSPAALSLVPHALAPVAELPVLEIVSAVHLICDLTLGLGKVAYDYLHSSPAKREPVLVPATAGAA